MNMLASLIKRVAPYAAVFLILLLSVYQNWESHQIAFGCLLMWCVVVPTSARPLGFFAAGLMAVIAVINRNSYIYRAEQLAVLAFILLVLAFFNLLMDRLDARQAGLDRS